MSCLCTHPFKYVDTLPLSMPYRNPEDKAAQMRRWRIRKQLEREQLEKGYNRLYHENIELKKQLKENCCNKTVTEKEQ